MVARGEFREDLLYRINLITVHLPPLRERPDDIPLLASRFLQAAAAAYRRDRRAHAGGAALAPGAALAGQRPPAPAAVERAVLVDTRDRLDVESFTELAAAPRPRRRRSLPPSAP